MLLGRTIGKTDGVKNVAWSYGGDAIEGVGLAFVVRTRRKAHRALVTRFTPSLLNFSSA